MVLLGHVARYGIRQMCEDLRELRRVQAWELFLLTRLNVCYWQKTISYRMSVVWWITVGIAVIGCLGSVIAYKARAPWVAAALPALTGATVVVLRGKISSLPNWKPRLWFERWSGLRHDVENLWRAGEKRGWANQNVISTLSTVVERERNYHSQEYETTNKTRLHECQRQLWSELGAPYDDPDQ